MGDPSIIRATAAHLDQLCPLFSGYRRFYQREPEPLAERRYLERRLRDEDAVVFLALDEEWPTRAAGFVLLYPTFDSVSLAPVWVLHDLFVAPRARRRGTGRELMEAAHEFCRESGAHRVDLATAMTNTRAIPLYESLGYEKDREFHYYSLEL